MFLHGSTEVYHKTDFSSAEVTWLIGTLHLPPVLGPAIKGIASLTSDTLRLWYALRLHRASCFANTRRLYTDMDNIGISPIH